MRFKPVGWEIAGVAKPPPALPTHMAPGYAAEKVALEVEKKLERVLAVTILERLSRPDDASKEVETAAHAATA